MLKHSAMKYKLITTVLSAFIISFSAQAGNKPSSHLDSVNALKKVINESNTVHGMYGGFAATPTRAWASFAYLVNVARESELLSMTKGNNPALRLYAYTALVHRKYKNIDRVKHRLLMDKSEVSTLSGCIMSATTVAEAIDKTGLWYHEEGMNDFLKAIKKDKKYRNQVYAALINNTPLPGMSVVK